MSSMNKPGTSGGQVTREYTVRVPKGVQKKINIMKFNPNNKVDFSNLAPGAALLERENNFREFKLSHDIDLMPKFGAGSEFGREQKDEARRRKYGVIQKKYRPGEQPWLLQLGRGKEARRFKGRRDGGILENASYYVFTQCADGAFEAHLLSEWYNFMPVAKYKHLNADEAEEEFEKRDKTMNYFNVMLQRRLKGEDANDADLDKDEKSSAKKGAKKGKKEFKLTEMDEWAELSDAEASEEEEEEGSEGEKRKKEEAKGKDKKAVKKKPKKERDLDEEAEEESDDQNEGEELDYMTDTDSDDDEMYKEANRDKTDKYEDKGVEDVDGLRKALDSGDEDEEEKKADEGEEEKEEEEETDRPKREGSDSESSDSGSESDPEKEGGLGSALFMPKKEGGKPGSRSATPTHADDKKGKKRKTDTGDSPLPKKTKVETVIAAAATAAASTAAAAPTPSLGKDEPLEEAVRRYLQRKPMTVKDLLQKLHKSTGTGKEQLVKSITVILKRLNPDKVKIQDKLYLHIKT